MLTRDYRDVHYSLAELIRRKIQGWREAHDEDGRFRVAEAVAMTKRERGDYFGKFNEDWLDANHQLALVWQNGLSKGMMSYPLIARSIRAKQATEITTPLKFSIEPVYKDADLEAMAERLEQVFSYLRRKHLDTNFDYQSSYIRQTSRVAWLYTTFSKKGGNLIPVPEMQAVHIADGAAQYLCGNCGGAFAPEQLNIAAHPVQTLQGALSEIDAARAQGALSTPEELNQALSGVSQIEEDLTETDCPGCGQLGTLQSQHQIQVNAQQVPTGRMDYQDTGELRVNMYSPFQTRMDELNTTGFKYKQGHWFNFMLILPLYEALRYCKTDEQRQKIQALSPDHWSDALHWHYELGKARGNRTPYSQTSLMRADQLVALEFWWIVPMACGSDEWKAPSDEIIGDFQIRAGETLEKAFNRQFKAFDGVCALVCGDEILNVFNGNFTQNWNGIPWKIDPYSAYPRGEERLLSLQDVATRTFTMVFSYSQRSSAPKGIANPLFFRMEDLQANITGGWIYPKLDLKDLSAPGFDLQKHIFYLTPPNLPELVSDFIELIVAMAKEESGIYDETVGAGNSSNETARGRETAMTQSLNLQVPEIRTKGEAICDWFLTAVELIQRDAPDVYFRLFTDEDENEWTEADIELFRSLKFRQQFKVSVVDGSDIPRTQDDLEEALFIAISQGLFDPANPAPIDIRQMLLKIRGIDYDIDDYEKTRRLAKKRYERLKEIISEFNPADAIVFVEIADQMNPGMVIHTPMLNPELINQITTDPVAQMRPEIDNNFVFIKFYKEKMFGLLSHKKIDQVFLFALSEIIKQHQGQVAGEIAKQTALESTNAAAGAMTNGAASNETENDRNASQQDAGAKPGANA